MLNKKELSPNLMNYCRFAKFELRCFEELTIKFPTDYTVLIGINGSGKSAILDAIRNFLDLFTSANRLNQSENFFGIWSELSISPSDIRHKTILNGSIFEAIPEYPVSVGGIAEDITGVNISWRLTLTNSNKVPNKKDSDVTQLIEKLTNLHKQLVSGEKIILPIIAYYGTNRRWMATAMEKIDNHEIVPPEYFIPRLKGYSNCLNSSIFQLDAMRKWFVRMLLIERKKIFLNFNR